MAGSERVGYRNSKDTLLENAYYLLTPEAEVPQESVHRYVHLVEAIGAIPLKITPSIHDYATAAISHLPHVVASALVTLVQRANTLYEVEQSTQPKESKETDITKATKETTSSICRTPTPDEMIDMEELLPSIAAGGFKDLTRIASSDPGIWQQICHANATNLRVLIEEYIRILQSYLDASVDESQTALEDLFAKAKQYRDDLPITNKNPHLGSPTIRVDIADEPGALAAIATLLALRQISIKNIGIMHNREWEEGVLRIEFYTEEKQMEAAKVLRQKGYSVYDA
jgi:prephenate dehydrogenase